MRIYRPVFISILTICFLFGSPQAYGQVYKKVVKWLSVPVSEEAITDYLKEALPVLERTGSTLSLVTDLESPGGRHLYFQQEFDGQPILHAGVKITIGHDGRVWSLMDNLTEFHSVAGKRDMQPLTSRQMLPYHSEIGMYRYESSKVWLVKDGTLRATHRIKTFNHGPIAAHEIWLDGTTFEELYREDRGAYADSNGRGRVFRPDPCTVAEAAYGTQFTDANDNHNAVFESLMDTVVLRDLTFENGVFSLSGPYVTMEDISPFNIPPATSADGDFFFTRREDGFEDVMVYYHVDTYQRYIQSLGYTNLQNNPFRFDAHGISNQDQSVFVGGGADSYILFGDGGVDDAEDADVIIHEYGHALSDAASPDSRVGQERRGLDEGIGDYLAASYSYDLSNWNWHQVFNWDGHNEFWTGRLANTTRSYPPSNNSIYILGEIWASAMMEARLQIGGIATDKIFFEELYGNVSNMSLRDAARLALDADSMLTGGVNAMALTNSFCARNLLQSADCQAVSVQAPSLVAPKLTWSIDANGKGFAEWKLPAGTPANLILTNNLGQIVWLGEAPPTSRWEIPLDGKAAGLYVLQLQTETIRLTQKALLR